MRRLNQLSENELEQRLSGEGLPLRIGPYIYKLRSNLPQVECGIRALYSDFPMADPAEYVDFDVGLYQSGLRQRLQRRADFLFEFQRPFDTIPVAQSYAFLEWGMNWCVSLHANEYLKLHAAVVSREGRGVIMPGIPGAGKSTLCAGLGLSGWRILSDEHAMLSPGTIDLVPLCRPVSLKNESIDVVREFSPRAVFGPVSRETHKGVVAHLKADLAPDSHDTATVPAVMMVFPRYSTTEPQQLSPRRRSESFIIAAYHSFNYSLLGEVGFNAMKLLVDSVECYDLVYRDLNWAVRALETATA